MRTMRDRSLAEEWLPTRFNLALFRMLGLVVAVIVRKRRSSAQLLHHDREQHPLEGYVLSCTLVAVPSVHFLSWLLPRFRWPWLATPLLQLVLPFLATMAWDIVII